MRFTLPTAKKLVLSAMITGMSFSFNGCSAEEGTPSEPNPIQVDPPTPTDSDGDGINDANDNCPNEAGPASNNGCPKSNDGNDSGNASDNAKEPKEGDPTDIVLINVALGRKGYKAPYITSSLEAPMRLKTDTDPIMEYSDIVDESDDVIIFFGANANNDDSFPNQSIDMPEYYSLSELRNNQMIAFKKVDKDDPKANVKITINKPFSFTTMGTHLQGDLTQQVSAGEVTFERLKDDALGHESVKFRVGNLSLRDYGKLIVAKDAKNVIDTDSFKALFGENGNEIYGQTFQIAIDQDNSKPGLGGNDQRILMQPK